MQPPGNFAKSYESYYGKLRFGKCHGYGVLTCKNGDRYEGNWSGGKRSGQGIMTNHGGDYYKGQPVKVFLRKHCRRLQIERRCICAQLRPGGSFLLM